MATDFQSAIVEWGLETFGPEITNDKTERAHRFGEEAIELLQAAGVDKTEVLQLVDYVYGRPKGEMWNEIGGVMVCLAALCHAFKLSLIKCMMREYTRINTPEMIAKIRAKNAAKPKFSPLPGPSEIDASLEQEHMMGVA